MAEEDNHPDFSGSNQQNDNDSTPQIQIDSFGSQYQTNNAHLTDQLMNLLFHQQTPKNGSRPNEFTARGSWTQAEDEQLINAVSQLGPKKWIDIAKFVPTRTSKQCRERWHHRLDPAIKHDPFEPWEDQIIIEKQREIGNKWSVIAHELPGRSPSSIKNRWYSGLRSQHPTHAQMDMTSINMGLHQPQMDDDHQSTEIQNNNTDL